MIGAESVAISQPAVDQPVNPVADVVTGAVDAVFADFFTAAQSVIRFTFRFVDEATRFDVTAGPGAMTSNAAIASVWPLTMWLGGAVALMLACWQIVSALVRGDGRGLAQVVVGIAQFGLVTGSIVVVVQAITVVSDEAAAWILDAGLGVSTFRSAGEDLLRTDESGLAAVLMLVLGVVGIVGAIAVWVEFALRQIAVLGLVVASPIAAAGLVSGSTGRWFPTLLRWTVALLLAKPATAIVLVVGNRMRSNGDGLTALMIGTAVIVAITLVPWAMLRVVSWHPPGSVRSGSWVLTASHSASGGADVPTPGPAVPGAPVAGAGVVGTPAVGLRGDAAGTWEPTMTQRATQARLLAVAGRSSTVRSVTSSAAGEA